MNVSYIRALYIYIFKRHNIKQIFVPQNDSPFVLISLHQLLILTPPFVLCYKMFRVSFCVVIQDFHPSIGRELAHKQCLFQQLYTCKFMRYKITRPTLWRAFIKVNVFMWILFKNFCLTVYMTYIHTSKNLWYVLHTH